MASVIEQLDQSPLAGAFVIAAAVGGGWAGGQLAVGGEFRPVVGLAAALSAFVVAYGLRRAAMRS